MICEAKGNAALHLFDTFEGLPKASKSDGAVHAENQYTCSLESVQSYLQGYPNVHFYKGLFPDLAGAFSAPPVAIARPKLTSFRSYREKQVKLEKIINEEIPRNSKEIGVARSYGDLRENYEYKAAREMQGLLMHRKAELEQMLSEVRGSDFSGLPHEVAGQGTSVELKMPDGKKEIYHILGELDSDEKLGIISCRSRLAVALSGHRAGERIEIPGENSPKNCAIEAIRELPPEIKAWINGE